LQWDKEILFQGKSWNLCLLDGRNLKSILRKNHQILPICMVRRPSQKLRKLFI
jgi:hypothetical protein